MDDLKQAVDGFDLGVITNPQSGGDFIVAVVAVGLLGIMALFALRMVQNLLN